MLTEFSLKNFVLIEDAELRFGEGLNALSGETGAGKSLLASALLCALGQERLDEPHIRTGAEAVVLTAVFRLPKARLRAIEQELALELPDAESDGLIVERSLSRSSKGRARVCGRIVPLATLRELGSRLVEFCAQNEETRLREPAFQRQLLDLSGGLSARAAEVAEAYSRAANLLQQIEGGEELRRRKGEELARASEKLEQLEELKYDLERDGKLEERIALLQNASAIRTFCDTAIETLYEADDAVSSKLRHTSRQAAALGRVAPSLAKLAEGLDDSASALDDCVHALRSCRDSAEDDPAALETAVSRRHQIADLARMHNVPASELPVIADELRAKVDELSSCVTDEKKLMPSFEEAAAAFASAGLRLRKEREKAAASLVKSAQKHFKALGMEGAELEVALNSLAAGSEKPQQLIHSAGASGLEEVEFRIRANPGESWGSLKDTASGGETARIFLALLTALANAHPCGTLFFDEIDAGVGGRLGDAIAGHLSQLAGRRQVICITHLPQVASQAAHHICARKDISGGRTRTSFTELKGENRISEVAAMIRGGKSLETTTILARQMLGEDA